jgi:hypothetical protein
VTATLAARTPDPLTVAAAVAPRPGTLRRRSPAMVSLGVILVVVCALAAWEYVSSSGPATREYLAVYADVPAGAQITADDLQVVAVTPVAGLTPVPAAQETSIVGQYATVHLLAGTLLTTGAVAPQRTVIDGHALVGVELAVTQRPARGLRPDDQVRVVEVPDPNGGADGDTSPTLPTLVVTVADIGAIDDADGSQAIDLLVPLANVNAVASLGVRNRLAVVLVNGS